MARQALVRGRDEQRQQLDRFLSTLPSRPAAALLRGPAGIGKSALWQATCDVAAEQDLLVLRCSGSAADAQIPLAALTDLLTPVLDRCLPMLSRPRRETLETALLLTSSRQPLDPRAVPLAVLDAIRALATAGPVLLAVDDLHWVDAASSEALGFALRRIGEEPVGLLAAMRSDVEGGSLLLHGYPHPQQVLDLEPLDRASTAEMLHAAGFRLDEAVVDVVWTLSAGNPLAALEIASSPSVLDRGPAELEPIALFRHRLRALSPGVRQAVLAVADGAGAPARRLAEADCRFAEDLAAAVQAGLLHESGPDVRLRHPLVREAALAESTPADRTAIHRRLLAQAADPEERALHLALLDEADPEELGDAHEALATRARLRGALARSAWHWERAAASTPADDPRHGRRQAQAALAHLAAGRTEQATILLEAALQRPLLAEARAEAAAALGQIYTLRDGWQAGAALLEEAITSDAAPARIRGRASAAAGIAVITSGDTAATREHGQRALELSQSCGDTATTVTALSMLAFVDFVQGEPRPAKSLARARALLPELPTLVDVLWHPALTEAIYEKYTGDVGAGRQALVELGDLIRETGDETTLPFVLGHLAEAECWLGLWAEADEHAREAMEIAERRRLAVYRSFGQFALALVEAYRGRVDRARAEAGAALTFGLEHGVMTTVALASLALGFAEVGAGNGEAAAAALGPLVALTEQSGAAISGWAPFYVDAVEALISVERLDQAGPLAESLNSWAEAGHRWAQPAAAHACGVVAAASREPDVAVEHLDRATDLYRWRGLPFAEARAQLAAGTVLRRARRRAEARPRLTAAHEAFVRLGASTWTRRAAEELSRLGAEAHEVDELTPAEARVATLVRSGLSNREVAATLHVTPKAVEQHLTRIYRKLGVSSRTQLARSTVLPG